MATNDVKNAQFATPDLPEKELLDAGIDLRERSRSGSFMQIDGNVTGFHSLFDGIELLPREEAIKKYPRLTAYLGKALARIGKRVEEDMQGGFFLRVKKGAKVVFPVQVCLFLKSNRFYQRVYNIIIVEEGAQAYVINGCVSDKATSEAIHLGISEYFIEKGAYLNFTMIHSWNEHVEVKPCSVAVVEEDGVFVSNYICLKPVKSVVMYPACVLNGRRAKVSFASIIMGHKGGFQDIGSRVILGQEDTSAEIVSRAVSMGGRIVVRGHLKADRPKVKAHLECQGLIVSETGSIHAIPELETAYRDVDMSHEAAIGKISREEIEYLASRGIDENTAQSVIIRGFMDTDILGLPEELKSQIEVLKSKLTEAAM